MNRKLGNRLSIKNLASQNNTTDKKSNISILKKDKDMNRDTYVVEIDSLTAGIANLDNNNLINIYIGLPGAKNITININEFNKRYIIMEDYNCTD